MPARKDAWASFTAKRCCSSSVSGLLPLRAFGSHLAQAARLLGVAQVFLRGGQARLAGGQADQPVQRARVEQVVAQSSRHFSRQRALA